MASFAEPERRLMASLSVPGSSGLPASLTVPESGLSASLASSAEKPSGSPTEAISETPVMVTSGCSDPLPGKSGATSYLDISDVSDGVISSCVRAVRDHISLLQAQPGELEKEDVMKRYKAFLRKLHVLALSQTNLTFLKELRKEFGWDQLSLEQFLHTELLNHVETPKSPMKQPFRKVLMNREPEPSSLMIYRDVRISLGLLDDPAKVSIRRATE